MSSKIQRHKAAIRRYKYSLPIKCLLRDSLLTTQELKHGLIAQGADFLTKAVWRGNLQLLGFEHRGHRLVRRKKTLTESSVALLERCPKHGVGKRIGGAVYVHRNYEAVLGDLVAEAQSKLPNDFQYTVIKHNEMNGNLSFIDCPDFDEAEEPSTGDYAVVKADGTVRLHNALDDPYIYHHKWLFVGDDYEGFDVEQSRARSRAWLALDGVDKSRIGRASYWFEHVVPRLDATETQE